jgi:hypothetical protein
MSEDKKQDDLNAFETALAALVPRTDRIDRDRLMFLAGQQSLLSEQKIMSPLPLVEGRGEGGTIVKPIPSRAWGWPGAFAAMSAVAAALFVMLVFRTEPGKIKSVAKPPAPDELLADNAKESTDIGDHAHQYADQSRVNRTIFSLAALLGENNRKSNGTDSTYSYPRLLNQILDKGVNSWKPKAAGPYVNKAIITPPQTSRELMNQLLEQMGSEPI